MNRYQGEHASEWQLATSEARRALFEAFHDRHELAELAAAAYGGPVRFADRLRQTEFGSRNQDPSMGRDEYLGVIYGEDATFGDPYSSGYLYHFQAVAPYVANLH